MTGHGNDQLSLSTQLISCLVWTCHLILRASPPALQKCEAGRTQLTGCVQPGGAHAAHSSAWQSRCQAT